MLNENSWAAPHLERLVAMGYGRTPALVIEYLVRREIDDLFRAAVLKPQLREWQAEPTNNGERE